GIPDVVDDGRNGLLVEPGDAQALAAALRRLWSSPDLRERLGAAATETSRSLSWSTYGERLVTGYARLLASGSRLAS
ncbi:MAG: glycosyltransferase, partial [Candidatus Binatia bacterium]